MLGLNSPFCINAVAEFSTSKTLIKTKGGDHPAHWYGIPVRVLLLTFVGTLLAFAVSLLLAILGTLIVSAIRGVHPDMRLAYGHIALPIALVAGGIIVVLSTALEIRHYQQRRTLHAIERMR
jgi:hypothetical protein